MRRYFSKTHPAAGGTAGSAGAGTPGAGSHLCPGGCLPPERASGAPPRSLRLLLLTAAALLIYAALGLWLNGFYQEPAWESPGPAAAPALIGFVPSPGAASALGEETCERLNATLFAPVAAAGRAFAPAHP